MMRRTGSIYQTWLLGLLSLSARIPHLPSIIFRKCHLLPIIISPLGGVSVVIHKWEASPLGLRQTHLDINHKTILASPTIVTPYRTILKMGWGPKSPAHKWNNQAKSPHPPDFTRSTKSWSTQRMRQATSKRTGRRTPPTLRSWKT